MASLFTTLMNESYNNDLRTVEEIQQYLEDMQGDDDHTLPFVNEDDDEDPDYKFVQSLESDTSMEDEDEMDDDEK